MSFVTTRNTNFIILRQIQYMDFSRSSSKFGCDLGRSGRPCGYIPAIFMLIIQNIIGIPGPARYMSLQHFLFPPQIVILSASRDPIYRMHPFCSFSWCFFFVFFFPRQKPNVAKTQQGKNPTRQKPNAAKSQHGKNPTRQKPLGLQSVSQVYKPISELGLQTYQ